MAKLPIKKDPNWKQPPELRIRGISRKTKQVLENIAYHSMGLSLNDYMKAHITSIVINAPEHHKRDKPKDDF